MLYYVLINFFGKKLFYSVIQHYYCYAIIYDVCVATLYVCNLLVQTTMSLSYQYEDEYGIDKMIVMNIYI